MKPSLNKVYPIITTGLYYIESENKLLPSRDHTEDRTIAIIEVK